MPVQPFFLAARALQTRRIRVKNCHSQSLRVLRRPQVQARTGLARSTLYELIARKEFPASIQLTNRTVGWLAEEVDHWIAARVERSRSATDTANDTRRSA